jgi:hypothetical protein
MSSTANVAQDGALKLIDTLKKAAGVLRDEGLPFALAGGAAAYARGAAPPTHDVDFVIREVDADAAARAFAAQGMRVEVPPEGWLIKAYDEDRMIDLIFRLSGHLDMQAVLDRAEEMNVEAVPMPVVTATAGSAFATAFLVLLRELRILASRRCPVPSGPASTEPSSSGSSAVRVQHQLAEDLAVTDTLERLADLV